MGIEAHIWLKKSPNNFEGIYCHFDGGIAWTGRILSTYYPSLHRIRRLLELGHLSCIGLHINPLPNIQHAFYSPAADTCVSYKRDGEPSQDRGDNYVAYNIKELMKKHYSYTYIFLKNEWYVKKYHNRFMLLREAIQRGII